MKNQPQFLRYGGLKAKLEALGIKEHRLKAALKNFPRIYLKRNSRAYYDWNTAKKIFNIKG
ncbi:MAG: hypothetical protein J6K91_05895 [Opitutales bacterium]|nr:hypothetical protein [Opitutales bacterium]